MKAMILAAGLGTRLRPLTDDRPKALVKLGGRTLLEIALSRLRSFDVNEVIINVHHFAGMVLDYLRANGNFGMRIEISREQHLLDTGGGLKKAAYFFLENADSSTPFFVHNVDVVSTIDLAQMLQFHRDNRALATLAVQQRESSRYLLFDRKLRLCGRRSGNDPEAEIVRPSAQVLQLGFCGIHVISPTIFSLMKEGGAFSITETYLKLAAHRSDIMGFRADGDYWRDLGTLESLHSATEGLAQQERHGLDPSRAR